MIFRLRSIFFLLLNSLCFWAQNWDFKKYTTLNGLMSNEINALYIDSKGMLWIFNGNGVTRYNGKKFNNYLNDSLIAPIDKSNKFTIKELQDGTLFYSMKYGYVTTSSKKDKYLDIYLSDTISTNNENGITNRDGIRYFKAGWVDFDFAHHKIINKYFETYPDNFKFPSNILGSNYGNIFYSFYSSITGTRVLYQYKNKKFKKVTENIPFIISGIFETESQYFILPEEYNISNPIIVVNKNNHSKLYIKKDKNISDQILFGNGFLYYDKIILPTEKGVLILTDNGNQFFIKDEINKEELSKNNEDVETFYQSLKKELYIFQNWIVNGYRLINLNTRKIFIPDILKEQILKGNKISEVIPDLEGNLWAGTLNGLYKLTLLPYEPLYKITDERLKTINDSLESTMHQCIKNFDNIEYCLNNEPEKIQILIPKIKDKFFKYDLNTHYITPIFVHGLQSPILKSRLYPLMAYKKLIVCQEYTRGIIFYILNNNMDSAYYHLFNYTNGLLSNYVENVFVDKNDNIWFITWDGIQFINYNDIISENYNQSKKFSERFQLDMIPFMKGADIYFADNLLLYKIPTEKVIHNSRPPNIVIEKIYYKLNNKKITVTFKQDSIYAIPHSFKDFTIDFFGVCLSDGSKVKYKYIIDNETYAQNEGEIILNNLSPELHKIEIYAANNFNLWTKQPIRFYLNILPPFWKTLWFNSIILILIITIIFIVIKWREQTLRKKQKYLEQVVNIRTRELLETTKIVQQKNKEIFDSIEYTQRLQKSSVPSEAEVKKYFEESFVIYQTKDIIGGDFYFCGNIRTNDGILLKGIVVGDCTGHGVPGAFLSILVLAYVKQSLEERDVNSPAEALEFISKKMIKALEYNSSQSNTIKDSADMICAVFNPKNKTLNASCAVNPIYIVRNKQLIEIPGQKRTVGYCETNIPFINQKIQLETGDMLYFFSDGYADQFGGKNEPNDKDKKFTKKRFKDLLTNIAHLPMEEQKQILLQKHIEWKGTCEQTDDITILGIRIT